MRKQFKRGAAFSPAFQLAVIDFERKSLACVP
jgi:hypothetical protein